MMIYLCIMLKKNSIVDVVTKEDIAYAFVKGIQNLDKLNKKTFNVTSEETILFKDLLINILKIRGLSFKYVLSRLFLEKNYYSPVCKDRDELEEIIHYRNDSLIEYYNRLKRKNSKRKFAKFLAKPFIRNK